MLEFKSQSNKTLEDKKKYTEKWLIKTVKEEDVKLFSDKFGIDNLVSSILLRRNITISECENILYPTIKKLMPNPFILNNMDTAVNLILESIQYRKKICIYGDYDVDGCSSVAIISKFFTEQNIVQ